MDLFADIVASGALVVSAVATSITLKARGDSKASATAAKRSADAAEISAAEDKRANDLAAELRAEQLRERDANAIRWELSFMAGDTYILTNAGSEDALNVRMEDVTPQFEQGQTVPAGTFIKFMYAATFGGRNNPRVIYQRQGFEGDRHSAVPL